MKERESARLVVIDPDARVLLFEALEYAADDPYREPGEPARDRIFWITPGGGVEPGESFAEAARRELFEETGHSVSALGEPVLYREKVLANGTGSIQHLEQFYCVRLAASLVVSTAGHTELELTALKSHRWWTLDELEATDEVIYPENFAALVRRLLNGD